MRLSYVSQGRPGLAGREEGTAKCCLEGLILAVVWVNYKSSHDEALLPVLWNKIQN